MRTVKVIYLPFVFISFPCLHRHGFNRWRPFLMYAKFVYFLRTTYISKSLRFIHSRGLFVFIFGGLYEVVAPAFKFSIGPILSYGF
jgi:hypothetical protein